MQRDFYYYGKYNDIKDIIDSEKYEYDDCMDGIDPDEVSTYFTMGDMIHGDNYTLNELENCVDPVFKTREQVISYLNE